MGTTRAGRSAKDKATGKLMVKSPFCYHCSGTDEANPVGEIEQLLSCSKCGTSAHPSCGKIPAWVANVAYEYPWECLNCKACMICLELGKENLLIFCDGCDRACHTYCNDPPFRAVPKGSWICQLCKTEGRSHNKRTTPKSAYNKKRVLVIGSSGEMPIVEEGEDDDEEFQPPEEDGDEEEEEVQLYSDADSPTKRGRGRPRLFPPGATPDEKREILRKRMQVICGSSDDDEGGGGDEDIHNARALRHRRNSLHSVGSQSSAGKRKRGRPRKYLLAVEGEEEEFGRGRDGADFFLTSDEEGATSPRKSGRRGGGGTSNISHHHQAKLGKSADGFLKISSYIPPPPQQQKTDNTTTTNNNRKTIKLTLVNKNGSPRRHSSTTLSIPMSATEPRDRWCGLLPGEAGKTEPYCPDGNDKVLFDSSKEKAKELAMALKPGRPVGATVVTVDLSSNGGGGDEELEVPKISTIQFGKWEIDTWYSAPYPEEYNQQPLLYLCEYCLKYMRSAYCLNRHKNKCPLKHPPGDEIYRDGIISMFEVDGRKNKIYCQNLCLLAKMFLDHKTLYYDVEPFLFYIMTERDETGHHFVGYFSKEKRSVTNYNLSCIVTLPIHQRKGYGNFLIDFSYLLSQKEGKTGSPEKPLSDLGLLSYRNYWRRVILEQMYSSMDIDRDKLSIKELVDRTCMTVNDVVSTLRLMEMITKNEKGDYVIRINMKLVRDWVEKYRAKGYPVIKPQLLRWSPFLLKSVPRRESREPSVLK